MDSSGILYVTDTNNHLIRKITPEGAVSTFAGSTEAQFFWPSGVAVVGSGDNLLIYVADRANHRIRKIEYK